MENHGKSLVICYVHNRKNHMYPDLMFLLSQTFPTRLSVPGAARPCPPPAPIDLADRPLGFPTKVPSNGVSNGV